MANNNILLILLFILFMAPLLLFVQFPLPLQAIIEAKGNKKIQRHNNKSGGQHSKIVKESSCTKGRRRSNLRDSCYDDNPRRTIPTGPF